MMAITNTKILYREMVSAYNAVDRTIAQIESLESRFERAELSGEQRSLLEKLYEVQNEFGYFVPGLEMELHEKG